MYLHVSWKLKRRWIQYISALRICIHLLLRSMDTSSPAVSSCSKLAQRMHNVFYVTDLWYFFNGDSFSSATKSSAHKASTNGWMNACESAILISDNEFAGITTTAHTELNVNQWTGKKECQTHWMSCACVCIKKVFHIHGLTVLEPNKWNIDKTADAVKYLCANEHTWHNTLFVNTFLLLKFCNECVRIEAGANEGGRSLSLSFSVFIDYADDLFATVDACTQIFIRNVKELTANHYLLNLTTWALDLCVCTWSASMCELVCVHHIHFRSMVCHQTTNSIPISIHWSASNFRLNQFVFVLFDARVLMNWFRSLYFVSVGAPRTHITKPNHISIVIKLI